MKFNKRALDSFVIMGIIIILISALVIFSIFQNFFTSLDTSTQNSVCSFNVISSKVALDEANKERGIFYVNDNLKTNLLEYSVRNPMCKTQIKVIDLSKFKSDEEELKEEVTKELGEMIEGCWKTFGEGKLPNTFGQGSDLNNEDNLYFSCYKFKIKMGDNKNAISVSDLINAKDGTLWQYNLKGSHLGDLSYLESKEKYAEKGSKYLSYAGYVMFGGHGYLEFLEKTTTKIDWLSWTLDITKGGLDSRQYSMSGPALESIESERYYEVRYYSPYMEESVKNVLNSIKIMPIGAESDSESIK